MNLKLLAIAFFSVASLQARSELALTDKCPGWQVVEQTSKYAIVQHDCTRNNGSNRSVQTIQITNNAPVTIDTLHIGDVYVLVPGPYGWDQYLLNGTLPHNFPQNYLRKCCWLRQTRAGNYTITHSAEFNPEELLVSNQR